MSFSRIVTTLFLLSIAAFTLLMLTKVIPYLSFESEIDFLTTKTDRVLTRNDFQAAFYVHIVSSWWVMGIGIFQFVPSFIKKYKKSPIAIFLFKFSRIVG